MKISIIAAVAATLLIFASLPGVVLAQKPDRGGGGNSGKPSKENTPTTVGYDISWPQCGKKLPSEFAFAIIGVNGGTAANTNPCLTEQLLWAKNANGTTKQPRIQLYVNTANPGEVIDEISTWPTNNIDPEGVTTDNPYGECEYANDKACSWQYGWNRASEAAVQRFAPAALKAGISDKTSDYVWWLDVELINTWQSGSDEALHRNVATLEGMTEYFQSKNAEVGLYATAYQWGVITGNFIDAGSNLNGLANWRPSGSNLNNAINNCTVDPLTPGGYISLTQYVQKNLDHNYSCLI
jgi:hypothetical protein